MEVICTEKHNIILFFIYPHNKFLALLLLNSLEKKNFGVATAVNVLAVSFGPTFILLGIS